MATPTTIADFSNDSGGIPTTAPIMDSSGNLFGTNQFFGGTGGKGSIYELVNTGGVYATAPVALVTFTGPNGEFPTGGLTMDAQGNLFGTTSGGGANGMGTVFELPFQNGTYAASVTTLISFDGTTNGSAPLVRLVQDAAGDLFGVTTNGGAGHGAVFELVKSNGTFASAPVILASFTTAGSLSPAGGLAIDNAGNLFGATQVAGGGAGNGTIYEIVNTPTGYAAPSTIATFSGTDHPRGDLTLDPAGNLFGAMNSGTVFEVANSGGTLAGTLTTLGSLTGTNGQLVIDEAGNIFGTTNGGGANGKGTVFEIANVNGTFAAPITVGTFDGTTNGSSPTAGLLADASGNLFGTTNSGGANKDGTVFELTGSGFQIACFAEGTRLATPSGERAVETLAIGDEVLTHAGEARPIVWIGWRRVEFHDRPNASAHWPVRVRAGAFGGGLPTRDLVLSPDHAVFVDGALVPVRHLTDGAAIAHDFVPATTYFHVELASHDVVLAAGLPCESYLDVGDRDGFRPVTRPATALPAGHGNRVAWAWQTLGCAELVTGGPRVAAIRRRLAESRDPETGRVTDFASVAGRPAFPSDISACSPT